ncbi:hypothetical protein [Autumnicola musiva]|uniref:PKD domain-containing protein n=1 Tax=Autumnicola musiva TaxID=3075589 RepID=A0ABU3D1P3_9FLAO|nr:hypothetical protein [Zunongwangia sp. F117]MDT0675260.1 hypothetical protein [Zunongwangia sp. F117]
MKNIKIAILAILAVGFHSCQTDDEDLPEVQLKASELNFAVMQEPGSDNQIILQNHTADVIPYWHFEDSEGNDLGHSNQDTTSMTFPFAGNYSVYYTAYTRGGAVEAEPVQVSVSKNDEEYFSEEEWNMLTNGVEGKTWVLDMANPVGWAGVDYPEAGDNWTWFPDYAGNEWVMANKNWGQMTFNLDGGYNVSVTQTALNSSEETTETGSFSYNVEDHNITFNGGVEPLYGGDYYGDVSNWTSVNVIELSENSLRLGVLRDQDRDGEGLAQIVFHYRPAEEGEVE